MCFDQRRAALLDSSVLKKQLDMRNKILVCKFITQKYYAGFVVLQSGDLLTSEN